MANRTDKGAMSAHGSNPQLLISTMVRDRIWNARFWKEDCFGLSANDIVKKVFEMEDKKKMYVCGQYSTSGKPSAFLCLFCKMLQIQPDPSIIQALCSKDSGSANLTCLAAMYWRFVGSPSSTVYEFLEPLLSDSRQINLRHLQGHFEVGHVDEFVDSLLKDRSVLGLGMPVLTSRKFLEDQKLIAPYKSSIMDDEGNLVGEVQEIVFGGLNDDDEDGEEPEEAEKEPEEDAQKKEKRRDSRDRDVDRDRRREERERSRGRERERERGRGRDREREREGRYEREHGRERERRGGRDREDRSRDRSRGRDREREREREERKERKEGTKQKVDPEIEEANALRAKLGLKPLRI